MAALGTILASRTCTRPCSPACRALPSPDTRTWLAHAISTGGGADAIASTPQPLRGLVSFTARSALVDGLNTIMLISAVVPFAAAVASFILIRERDFVALAEGEEEELELSVAA